MKKKKEQTSPNQSPNINFRRSPEYKSIYVNWVQGSNTPYDISLVMGEAFLEESGNFIVEQKARAIFSPLEAKLLLPILLSTVKNYEEQFGLINVPQGLMNQIKTQSPGEDLQTVMEKIEE